MQILRNLSIVLISTMLAMGCHESSKRDRDGERSDAVALPDTSKTGKEKQWQKMIGDLPEAALAIWTDEKNEFWLTGADAGTGNGPLILRRSQDGWTRYISGADGHLWWVFGTDTGHRFFVGEAGLFLRHEINTERFEVIDTGTEATLYGVWGTSPDSLWLVGGFVFSDGRGVVLRVRNGEVQPVVDLPLEVSPTAAFFKVWGTGEDNVWVVGEEGHLLHFDGATWELQRLENAQRLVTVHGSGKDNMVAVGGITQAALLEYSPSQGWRDATPPGLAMLQGVFVRADGRAAAAGMLNAVISRESGAWTELPAPPVFLDWHAVWFHANEGLYVAGGNLKSINTMNQGALYRYGPPTTEPDASWTRVYAARGNSDARTSEDRILDVATAADATADPEPSDDSVNTPDTGNEPDAESGSDGGAQPADVEKEVVDTDVSGDIPAADAVESAGSPDIVALNPTLLSITLGKIASDGLGFQPLTPQIPMEIVQGPQGGIHLEVVIDALIPGGKSVPLDLTCTTHIGGVLQGYIQIKGFPTFPTTTGSFRTNIFTVFFKEKIADPYVGLSAELNCNVEAVGQQADEGLSIFLVDEK